MNEETLNSLLALGFTFEDLYKRGLLVLKPAQDAQNGDFSQVQKMLDDFKVEIKSMIASANIQNATRTEDNDKDQMTVSAAIQGLYKGV